ncbi:DUF3135 domain-containing protein [Teredinibacter turnerae]|uniref:DUF3135 domain-containing protein n=1 Tax=Teredinibacter turnerae TaxID=2426 RepID=UPI00036D08CF|nr:DUF3135 domain-containing protein [Teredinibacter turnerae]
MTDWPSFERLFHMAEHEPEALEAFRQQEVAAIIDSAPEEMQRRLRGLQFQIDCQRELHQTPVGVCMAISQMMHESLGKLQSAMIDLQNVGLPEERANSETLVPTTSAAVIPFPVAGC